MMGACSNHVCRGLEMMYIAEAVSSGIFDLLYGKNKFITKKGFSGVKSCLI